MQNTDSASKENLRNTNSVVDLARLAERVQASRCNRRKRLVILNQYLVELFGIELFGIDELEEFRRGVELVGRPGQKRQSDNFWVVLQFFERYLTIYFESRFFPPVNDYEGLSVLV